MKHDTQRSHTFDKVPKMHFSLTEHANQVNYLNFCAQKLADPFL